MSKADERHRAYAMWKHRSVNAGMINGEFMQTKVGFQEHVPRSVGE